jgi:hypothetical protein
MIELPGTAKEFNGGSLLLRVSTRWYLKAQMNKPAAPAPRTPAAWPRESTQGHYRCPLQAS